MKTYAFVVEAVISMNIDVEAESLEEAIKKAQAASSMSLCHQCAGNHDGEWCTSGELDCEPTMSKLVQVSVDGAIVSERKLKNIARKWSSHG